MVDPEDFLRKRDEAAAARIVELKEAGRGQEAWGFFCRSLHLPGDPIDVVHAVYRWVYSLDEAAGFPAPAWVPDEDTVEKANITALCRELKLAGADEFHRWSVENRLDFWDLMIRKLGICFDAPPKRVLDRGGGPGNPRWLPGARMNVAANCFHSPAEQAAAIVGKEDGSLLRHSYGELRRLANRVANGLRKAGIGEGDPVAIVMPMTFDAVAVYLGAILAGVVVVSIADSFAPEEIGIRIRISNTKLVVTQDVIRRGGKEIPLFERVRAAGDWPAVAIGVAGTAHSALRKTDLLWETFLSDNEDFAPVSRDSEDAINILFSSGTTGNPKAIPWVQTTPIKCAVDGFIHHDIHPGDVVSWPTNLGWMMGPWLIFATMLNRGTIAIYEGAPHGEGFCRFVEQAEVNVLGVIPSLVRTWRESGVLDGADWRSVRAFSSTGECSNPADMFHLMSRAGFRPVIEYCGGTELGGGYISATVVKPGVSGVFNMPAFGVELHLLDAAGQSVSRGEVFLGGPSIGFSTRLLNADHNEVYFAGTPADETGWPLRRHGDQLERFGDGYYRALGRHDDTMNLGGIKVGSAEIERVLAEVPGVHEAVAVASDDAGPSRLIVFVVPNADAFTTVGDLQAAMQKAIRERLNPLFKISEVRVIDALPRTASNKIMRRELRALPGI